MAAVVLPEEHISPVPPLARLGGEGVHSYFQWTAVRTLDYLWGASTMEDRLILHPVARFLVDGKHDLDLVRRRTQPTKVSQPDDLRDRHPLIATLVDRDEKASFPNLDRLILVAVAAAVESTSPTESERVSKLTANIRGALQKSTKPAGLRNHGATGRSTKSDLRSLLSDAHSLPDLIRLVDERLAGGQRQLHRTFAAGWDEWIRDRLFRWMHADPDSLRTVLRPVNLLPSIDDPEVGIGGEAAPDGDSQARAAVTTTMPRADGGEPSSRDWSLAVARGLLRISHGDILVAPDQLAPQELIGQLLAAASVAATEAIGRRDFTAGEQPIALRLAAASGLREIDLPSVVWGRNLQGRLATVDPDEPWLYRVVVRPENAVKPDASLAAFLRPSEDVIRWPLPPSLHAHLRALSPGAIVEGSAVLPSLAADYSRRYRLWDVSLGLAPELQLSPGRIRLALAAEVARQFGPEVAQLSMGDTFSLTPGPAYYPAVSEDALTSLVACVQERWFNEPVRGASDGRVFGSRLILTDAAAATWPAQLRRDLKSASHRRSDHAALDAWRAHRNQLAGGLVAVVGARPGDWIGEFVLDQVIPEYMLVLVSDKASDPLREIRLAGTGRRWLADLRSYLDRLIDIAGGLLGPEAAELAGTILRSEQPLFATTCPNGGVERLTSAMLRQTMPDPLQSVPNFARHRLNQALQARGVSYELRHQQLGWVVSNSYLLADLSHWSPRRFGEAMADVLDDVLVGDGWYRPVSEERAWTWRGVPDRPLMDWKAEREEHRARFRNDLDQLRFETRKRWDEVTPSVLERLAEAIACYFPRLRLNKEARRIEWADPKATNRPVAVYAGHYALLCDRVRLGDASPGDATEASVARIHLYRLIRPALRQGFVTGPIPSRPFLSVTAEPSPFLRRSGLAVRQAEAFREALLARADRQMPFDQGPLTVWTVMGFSPVRDLGLACAASAAAPEARRVHARPELVRVPAVLDRVSKPLVFSGLPALALAKRGQRAPTALAPSVEQLGRWTSRALKLPFGLPDQPQVAAMQLSELLKVAGTLEISGPERLVSGGAVVPAAAVVERCLARDGAWSVLNAVQVEEEESGGQLLQEPEARERPSGQDAAKKKPAEQDLYGQLTRLLDPEKFGRENGDESDGHRAWKQKLGRRLQELSDLAEQGGNLGLLIGYVRHRLRFGGRRKKQLAHSTLGSDLTRFGRDLLVVAAGAPIRDWSREDYEEHYLALIIQKPVGARRQAFDALMNFHEYLMHGYGAPDVDTATLRAQAGTRGVHVNVGLLTAAEVRQTYEALQHDTQAETTRANAPLEAVRLVGLREVIYLLLEASGIRPSSAYGLTLGDLHLLGPGRDFVRVTTAGEYGRAKSVSSTGYIPLEGDLWAAARGRVIEWIRDEIGTLEAQGIEWWKRPLFALYPGSRRRVHRDQLLRRIDQLLKWASGDRKAHTYWLRKQRVTERHDRIASEPPASARAVSDVLRACGHSSMDIPVAHYISDPRVVYANSVSAGSTTLPGEILRLTGLQRTHLDMAWQRAGGAKNINRLPTVLDRLALGCSQAPLERITAPPALRQGRSLAPRHVAEYARALASGDERQHAVVQAGLTDLQAAKLDDAARALVRKKGVTPWAFEGLRYRSAVTAVPRSVRGSKKLYKLLDGDPPQELVCLSRAWAEQSHIEKLHEPRVVMELITSDDLAAARWLLEKTEIDVMIEPDAGANVEAALLCGRPDLAPARSHAAGLKWVLALVWIFVYQPASGTNFS